jgi:hypothetical protein
MYATHTHTHTHTHTAYRLGLGELCRTLAHHRKGAERVVLQAVRPLVVGPQVVNLLQKDHLPDFLADELDHVQLLLEARPLLTPTTTSHQR